MQTHVVRFPVKVGQPIRWFLCSDFHLGSVHCDDRRIKRELEAAADYSAAILINGDVFDAVTTGDKRYMPSETVARIANAKDAYKATVDLGCDILRPYRHNIHIIGIGNHEEAWIKYRQSDPVAGVIEKLNGELALEGSTHRIRHGGIAGWVVSMLEYGQGKSKRAFPHRLYYFHGAGGDSPVTLGTIDVNRKEVGFDFDAITFGHKHNRLNVEKVVCGVTSQGNLTFRQRVAAQTGSYFRNYRQTNQNDPLDYSYAESKAHAVKPMGGTCLALTLEVETKNLGGGWRIRQDTHSVLLRKGT